MPKRTAKDFSDLADLADLAYFEVDGQRNLVAVSPALERITGFSSEDVLGKSCLTVIRCDECRKGCGVFTHREVLDVPITLSRADGSTVQVLKSGRTHHDKDGEITGAIEVVVPIEGEDRGARNASATVDAVMGSLGRHFLTVDSSFRVAAHSTSLPDLMGVGAGALVGMPAERVFGSELFGTESSFRRQIEEGERREGVRAFLRQKNSGRLAASLSVGTFESGGPCAGLPGRYLIMMRPDKTHVDLPAFHGMISRSPAMQRIYRVIELLRENDSTVLITGESGTGKELVARALHETSHRSGKPLVTINCAAIPSELLESELFGHVRGAFTGAIKDRVGRFEMADGGTIFLDEIGDLALSLQAKLLRVLQQQTFERVGDSRTRKVDVRVIAATHADLVSAVAAHTFRQDLYYRLRVVPIEIPPLRDRREDLDLLTRHFLGKLGERTGRSLELASTATRALLQYRWPGNIRELENALEYATTVCDGQTIHVGDLPDEVYREVAHAAVDPREGARRRDSVPPDSYAIRADGPAFPELESGAWAHLNAAEAMEAEEILGALRKAKHRKAVAAADLGVSRTTLWRKMKQYGLD